MMIDAIAHFVVRSFIRKTDFLEENAKDEEEEGKTIHEIPDLYVLIVNSFRPNGFLLNSTVHALPFHFRFRFIQSS